MRAGAKKPNAHGGKNGKRVVFQAVRGQGHVTEGKAACFETQAEEGFSRDFRRFGEESRTLLHGSPTGLRSYAPIDAFGLMFQSLFLTGFSGNFDP